MIPRPHRRDGAFIGKLPHPRPVTLSSVLRSLPFLTASRPQPVSYACSCSAATQRIEYTSFFKPCLGNHEANRSHTIAKTLDQAGVKRIWGVTGDSLNGLSDSLHRMGTIEWLGTRHEEVAAFAAGAEAQLTGQLAVCAGSCGPGNLHLINGLFDCHRNHVPVLAIAAHIPSSEIGSGYFQETHPQELFRECSHYCELVSNPEQLPRVLEIAMRKAILNRGVSVVVLPGDVALRMAPEDATLTWHTPALPLVQPPMSELNKLAETLNKAKNITLMCGRLRRRAR